MITYSEGELLNSETNIIVNRVGIHTTLNNNFSKKLYRKYPRTYNSLNDLREKFNYNEDSLLGRTQLINIGKGKYICNLITHSNHKDDFCSDIDLKIFEKSIQDLKRMCIRNNYSISFPYNFKFRNNSICVDKVIKIIEKYFLDNSIDCQIIVSKKKHNRN